MPATKARRKKKKKKKTIIISVFIKKYFCKVKREERDCEVLGENGF